MKYRLFETDKNNNKYVLVEGTYLQCLIEKITERKGKIEKIEEKNCNYTDQWQRNSLEAIERDKKK